MTLVGQERTNQKNWQGRYGLQFIEMLTKMKQMSCKTAKGLFRIFAETSGCSTTIQYYSSNIVSETGMVINGLEKDG